MARPRKDYKILFCRIERGIYEQLDKFCERTGQTKTVAVERILGSYFQDYFSYKDNTVKNNTIR